ncbi:Tc toxin subunit A-related protein [Nakamurella sp. GG22]
MDKQELLYLEKHSQLSVNELLALDARRAEPAIIRLQDRITKSAVQRLDANSGQLREIMSTRRLNIAGSTPATSLRDATIDALRVAIQEEAELGQNEDTLNELHQLEESIERPSAIGPSSDVSIGDLLRLDEPIAFHPEFARDLAAARLYLVSDAMGLPDNVATVLVERVGSVYELTDDRLRALVEDGSFSADEARKAGLGAAMFNLLDDRPELVRAAKARVADIEELAGMGRDDWVRLIQESRTIPPGGIDPEEYAVLLAHKVERVFPTETLHKRLRETDVAAIVADNSALHAMRDQNPGVGIIGVRDFSSLDDSSFSEDEVATLKAHFENTVGVANRYAGMRLASVFDDRRLSDSDREGEVSRRIELANGFLADNPGALGADLTHGSDDIARLSFGAAADDDDRAMMLANARVYQRALAVTDDIDTAEKLVAGGFRSALTLAMTRSELIVAKTGLPAADVAAYKAKAEGIASGLSAHVGSIIDIIKGQFVDFAVGNMSPKLGGWLKEIPGFEDFFGNQDFCDCKHCNSILSPAAYFVDLMTFVEDHITEPVFASKPTHPLTLRKRRPDLWKLEVTCHNSHTPIPYLVIVNEILENQIALSTGFAGGLDDRVAVRASVYKNTLQNSAKTFGLPFNLAFEQVKGYLRHFEQTLGDVASAANVSGDKLARARLRLPAKDFDLIVTPNTSLPFLIAMFGIPFTLVGGAIQRFDAQQLLPPLAVSRSELADLTATHYVTADGAVTVRVRGSKRSAQSVQNDIEHIEGLTPAVLDRMHRFVRLWRATGWRIGELDLALRHVHQAAMGADLGPAVVAAIAWIQEEMDRRAVSIDEFLALWSPIPQLPLVRTGPATDPTMGVGATEPAPSNVQLTVSLLDRLFNKSRFVDAAGPYPQPATSFLHAGLASAPPAAVDPNLHRLLAGLGVQEAELLDLVRGLARPLGIDLESANDNDKHIDLTIENLTLLYRHARLSRLLRVSPKELFALAALATEIPLAHVHGAADLAALFRVHSWCNASGWDLGELVDIARPGLPPIITSSSPVAGTAGGETVTSIASNGGTAQNAETVTFGVNPHLAATITDWNSQVQNVIAFPSDAFGVEDIGGQHLSLRPAAGTGADSQLEVAADSTAIFTPAPPVTARGATHPSPAAAGDLRDAAVVAQEFVDSVAESGVIVFADTVFAEIAPTAPSVTSRTPFAPLTGGESVTYTPVRSGRSEPTETVTFAAATTVDAAVLDWNGQATATRAFRSASTGVEDPDGNYLSLVLRAATGSTAKIVIDMDSTNIFAAAVPQTTTGAEITDAQSRAIVAANPALVVPADSQSGYRVGAGVDPTTTPLTLPAGVPTSLAGAIKDVILGHHSSAILGSMLPIALGVGVDHLDALVQVLGVDLGNDVYFVDLLGDTTAPSATADLIRRLCRVATVFGDPTVFTPERIRFIGDNQAIFGIADFDAITTASARQLAGLREIVIDRVLNEDDAPDLEAVLAAFHPVHRFANADQTELAKLLRCGTALSQSLQVNTQLSATAIDAVRELIRASSFVQMLRIGADVLTLALSSDYDELASAGDAIQSAIRASFEDEDLWSTTIEPIENALLSRRRDGLVNYLVNGGSRIFNEVDDLYHYFLLDVEVEGCMRTSRVAAAIDSVQLYVHRCARNLEGTLASDPNPIQVPPESVIDDEWAWRKNYRVWEANRKVFLYPENYIEPELRDDKTPLFVELEEDLLSREVTDEAIIEAYGKYLRGFDEVAHLTICGSYHEVDEDSEVDVLHLFGVTQDDPPVFYYRRVENVHFGIGDAAKATHWGNWESLNIQVPVRKIAPVVHNSQLFVFWIRYVTKAQNSVKDGASKFTGYQHTAYVDFSRREVDGRWTTPQKLRLDESPFVANSFPESYKDNGVVLDPIVPKDTSKQEIIWFEFTFYSNFEPLYDDVPHEIPRDDYTLEGFQWDQLYPASGEQMAIRGVNFQLWSPVDLYRFKIGKQYEYTGSSSEEGVPWLNPGLFILIWALSGGNFDLTSLLPSELVWSRLISNGTRRELHSAPSGLPCFDTYTYATLLLDETRPAFYTQKLAATDPTGSPGAWTGPQWDEVITDYLQDRFKVNRIGDAPSDVSLDVVNGSVGDVIIQTRRDAFYLQHGARADGRYHLRRLNTSVSENIADVLFNQGLEALLETKTQFGFAEAPTGLNLDPQKVFDASKTAELDFDGPTGSYLREIFFHIPFLIADHFNSQGRFAEAQRWYHYVFDPTASETITKIPAGLTAEERQRRELDRNWRYREFRNLSLDTLRAQLTNAAAIEQYKRDPFNPHAIARLRISAYQKAIVMKYIDNLLDWGDELFIRAFAELNPELLREATFTYISARELLGDRPAQLGDCGEGRVIPKTYSVIKKMLVDDSEFLMEIESIMSTGVRTFSPLFGSNLVAVDSRLASRTTKAVYRGTKTSSVEAAASGAFDSAAAAARPGASRRELLTSALASAPVQVRNVVGRFTVADSFIIHQAPTKNRVTVPGIVTNGSFYDKVKWLPGWGVSLGRQISPVFCVPANNRIGEYWDRVEERLYKIRHCQDINGVFRLLPLFAPELDPGLLVGGAAAGVSLEELLASASGALPPYRYRYLVDKARAYASTVQGFGAALLSALEKRDAEDLNKLRNIHQKNVLSLLTEVRKNEVKVAEEAIEVVARREAAAQYRKQFYEELLSTGLTGAELTQTGAQLTSMGVRATQTALAVAAGITYLLPQVGSPFSMKYGGQEVGNSLKNWSAAMGIIGQAADITAAIAGLAAGFERRAEGWEHQRKLAEHDVKVIEKDLVIANLRRDMASRALQMHEQAIAQQDEVMDFFAHKFSNFGLYTYLSRTLQQLHRAAYEDALVMARLAERAYRFERQGDSSTFVGGEWDASRSGLLAGERLVVGLNNMDRRYVESSRRQAEINQSFSLSQIAPSALIDLKESASCRFSIPEFYFDLYYPGQYRRQIRGVRLTIPCITGPYTNVSARLTLERSFIRKEAVLGAAALHEVPVLGSASVATSTGQGDAGIFEFSFRDDRYLPFEGAGAVTEWLLELPAGFRPFDYHSINDIIVNISYVADEDGGLRQDVERGNAALEGALLNYLTDNTLTRVFSLRQEYSTAFNRLISTPAGTVATFDIEDRHFPLFLQRRTLQVAGAAMVIVPTDRANVGSLQISINGTPATGFSTPSDPATLGDQFGGLPSIAVDAGVAGGLKATHSLVVDDAGTLADPAGRAAFAPDALRDILLVIEYGL